MGDWLLALPLLWMTLVIFAAAYLVAAGVYLVVVGLAMTGRTRVFRAFSPEMLSPLGVIFALLVGFVAFQAWNDFDKAKIAVETEASALRGVAVLDESLPEEQRIHLRTLINRHIDEAVNREWPAMAQHGLTLASPPTALIEALQLTVSLKPQDESQRMAQREIMAALNRALDARRQRITISQSGVGAVQWGAIMLLGLCMLIAIAMVHSDNRQTCAIAVTLFATSIALSALMIAPYSRPFTGANSVGPELLTNSTTGAGARFRSRDIEDFSRGI
jgi:hypothetical protein